MFYAVFLLYCNCRRTEDSSLAFVMYVHSNFTTLCSHFVFMLFIDIHLVLMEKMRSSWCFSTAWQQETNPVAKFAPKLFNTFGAGTISHSVYNSFLGQEQVIEFCTVLMLECKTAHTTIIMFLTYFGSLLAVCYA